MEIRPERRACTWIVPNDEVMSDDEILAENHIYPAIFYSMTDDWSALQWCARRRLLANTNLCKRCGIPRGLIKQCCTDARSWRCPNCRSTKSVRHGSCFNRSHLTLRQVVLIFFGWANDWPRSQIVKETRCNSEHTVLEWYSFCRDICEEWLELKSQPIGGLDEQMRPKIVAVDESKFFYQKFQKGDWKAGHWLFGGIEKRTNRCFLVDASDRSDETIRQLTVQWILPGTHIVSNGWPAYNDVESWSSKKYTHETVALEQRPDTVDQSVRSKSGHTLWTRLRRKIPRRVGTNDDLSSSYLHEMMWKNAVVNKERLFEHFLIAVNAVFLFI